MIEIYVEIDSNVDYKLFKNKGEISESLREYLYLENCVLIFFY